MDDLLDDVYYQKRRNQEKTTRDLKTGTPIQEKARVSKMTTNGCSKTIAMQQPKQEGNGEKPA